MRRHGYTRTECAFAAFGFFCFAVALVLQVIVAVARFQAL